MRPSASQPVRDRTGRTGRTTAHSKQSESWAGKAEARSIGEGTEVSTSWLKISVAD